MLRELKRKLSAEVSGSREDLIKAMRFKANHIKAKADHELFEAVAKMLAEMYDGIEPYQIVVSEPVG